MTNCNRVFTVGNLGFMAAMTTALYSGSSATVDHHPVFQGFADSRMSGKEIASILGVTPPTVSKWRKGKARVPAVKLAFLTLILANWLDEMENKARLEAGGDTNPEAWRPSLRHHIDAARRSLKEQEAFNAVLPPEALLEGARLFRDWWSAAGLRGGWDINLRSEPNPGLYGSSRGALRKGRIL